MSRPLLTPSLIRSLLDVNRNLSALLNHLQGDQKTARL